jgi:hypothetical protein
VKGVDPEATRPVDIQKILEEEKKAARNKKN